MFDKVKAGGAAGGVAALLLSFAQSLFPDLQVPEGSGPEETIGRIVLHLVPVLVGLIAAYRKRERTGYGSVLTVATTGQTLPPIAPGEEPPPGPYVNRGPRAGGPQEPTRYDHR